jgi:hypothetical protein
MSEYCPILIEQLYHEHYYLIYMHMLNNCVLEVEVKVNNNYMCITQSDLHYSEYQLNQHICNFSFRSSINKYIFYTKPLHGNIILVQINTVMWFQGEIRSYIVGGKRINHRTAASHCQSSSHDVVSSTPHHERESNS